MNEALQTSNDGVALIKRFEGCRLKAYPDPGTGGDPWTIGYGTTTGVRPGMVITDEQATMMLARDLVIFEHAIKGMVTVPLTQHQFDALVCFTYNVGSGNLRTSSLLKKLNSALYSEIPDELMRWTKAAGRVLPGLVARRQAEGLLWQQPL
jgi:lysozyme